MTQPTLHLYDSQTRSKRAFVPLNTEKKIITMYVCGITPYDDAHIGHARVYVVFDVLYRLLKHLYEPQGYQVHYLRNYTDIDDKIIQRAAENGEEPTALSERVIQSFEKDMADLGCLKPTHEPKVSTSLPAIVSMVNGLLEKGMAYVTPSGDVMYRTARFPRFGQLAGRKLDEQQAGARVAVDDEKESPHDFVVWKANAKSATKLEQAFNPTDYGATFAGFNAPGRPGWHIECSAMSYEYLSKNGLGVTLDIHGGGEDLKFPHHSCEIAQSEGLFDAPLANYWLHNSFITVNGTKMSKSLGNFATIKGVINQYGAMAIRLWLLQTHYRKPVDYSEDALQAAVTSADKILLRQDGLFDAQTHSGKPANEAFFNGLLDDMNTAKALAALFTEKDQNEFMEMGHFLNLLLREGAVRHEEVTLPPQEEALLLAREVARKAKDWAASDRLRDELLSFGIIVEDHKNGTTTWRRG